VLETLGRELPLLAVVGPTAVGKSAVAAECVRLCDNAFELVSCDSMQVYRGMDIGTAKPTADEQRETPVHLIDVVDPDQEFTLVDYKKCADRAFQEIRSRGKMPLLVGGTGLYMRSVTTVLDIPAAPPNQELRDKWSAFAETHGQQALYDELRSCDAETADRVHPNDRKRIIRALEVFQLTNVPMSEWHRRNREIHMEIPCLIVGLRQERQALVAKINERVESMMEMGFLGEVRGLLDRGYGPDLKSMQGLGYKQLCRALDGSLIIDAAVEEIKQQTRSYARRQMIWFRGDSRTQWVDVDGKNPHEIAMTITKLAGFA